jgi:hypothetical protein
MAFTPVYRSQNDPAWKKHQPGLRRDIQNLL